MRRAAELAALCERAQAGGSEFTFDERRLALATLGFRAFANGEDAARWRYETDA